MRSKKIIKLSTAMFGATALLLASASYAGPYHHHWHTVKRTVHYRGDKKIVRKRECKINRNGFRRCYITRRVKYL